MKRNSAEQTPGWKTHTAVLGLFIILSIIMLWPLPRFMTNRLVSPVDPLLNSWIMAWDVHQLLSDPLHLFDANIFYPNTNALAYSEHLIVLALIAMPVLLITGNPILGYNVIQLLCFVLSGFFAYLLARHLLRNGYAAFIAGFVFAFHPYRFRQVGHIQNLAVFWTPLCLLYLHRLITKPSRKNMLLFGLFFTLQALSCGYLGVFLAFILALMVLYYLLFLSPKRILPLLARLALAAVLSGLVMLPFLYPYLQVKEDFQFERTERENIRFSANIIGYATISRFNENVFYHRLSFKNRGRMLRTEPEVWRPIGRGLFPGILVILLAVGAVFPSKKRSSAGRPEKNSPTQRLLLRISHINFTLLCLAAMGAAAVLIFHILSFNRQGGRFAGIKLTGPALLFLLLYISWIVLTGRRRSFRKTPLDSSGLALRFYLFLAVFTALLSLGTRMFYISRDLGTGPYWFLYRFGFFFKGIRVPERFGLIAMLALSLLAGFGAARVMERFQVKGRRLLTLGFLAILIYEFICVPFPTYTISRSLPPVYQWLKSQQGDVPILEYPLETMQVNKEYMFWSTYHWKKLANGSSGFNPPHFYRLRKLVREDNNFPSRKFIDVLKSQLKVKYLILHLGEFSRIDRERFLDRAAQYPEDLRLAESFENHDYVFEVLYSSD